MGSSQGEGRKKGHPDNEDDDDDDDDDDEVVEVPVPADPQSQATYPCLVGEMSVMGALVEGVPKPLYDEHMLIVQGRIAVVMEWMALAMEVQAGAIQAYVRHMTAFPLWPQEVQAGVVPGRVRSVAEGSRSGVKQSELAVSRVAEEGREQNEEDAEGDVVDMQE
ncbi:hypothetical protein EDC04DRAFT_2607500 [Pisolithus marmoratus]|nr:hypothetical protein EDC04DRAFT_2607500 [Pisolithus marmoratus]